MYFLISYFIQRDDRYVLGCVRRCVLAVAARRRKSIHAIALRQSQVCKQVCTRVCTDLKCHNAQCNYNLPTTVYAGVYSGVY